MRVTRKKILTRVRDVGGGDNHQTLADNHSLGSANQLFKVYIIMLLLLAFIFLETDIYIFSKKMNAKRSSIIIYTLKS